MNMHEMKVWANGSSSKIQFFSNFFFPDLIIFLVATNRGYNLHCIHPGIFRVHACEVRFIWLTILKLTQPYILNPILEFDNYLLTKILCFLSLYITNIENFGKCKMKYTWNKTYSRGMLDIICEEEPLCHWMLPLAELQLIEKSIFLISCFIRPSHYIHVVLIFGIKIYEKQST